MYINTNILVYNIDIGFPLQVEDSVGLKEQLQYRLTDISQRCHSSVWGGYSQADSWKVYWFMQHNNRLPSYLFINTCTFKPIKVFFMSLIKILTKNAHVCDVITFHVIFITHFVIASQYFKYY